MRFNRVNYFQLDTISRLFTERSNTENLIRHHSNILIQATKSIDEGVIKVKPLEWWHRLKIHRMPLIRYFGKEKIEVLSWKIKSFTEIKLKTTS